MAKLNVSVEMVETYNLRKNSEWANIAIQKGGGWGDKNAFQITITSGWGTWSYHWGNPGCDWRKFLANMDLSYFARKLGVTGWYDAEATEEAMKTQLKEYAKRKGSLYGWPEDSFHEYMDDMWSGELVKSKKNVYRRAWKSVIPQRIENLLSEFEEIEFYDQSSIYHTMPASLHDIFDEMDGFEIITGIVPAFANFYEYMWPEFIEYLKSQPNE